jgi:hypothetical protein
MVTEIYPEDDGLLACEDCRGTGRIPLPSHGDAAICPECEGEGYFHPFLSFVEYAEQVRERHPDAVFVARQEPR